MRKIPPKLRQELDADPYYHECCIMGRTTEKIDWHHNFTWQGSQLNEAWCILPLSETVHNSITQYKDICDWIMLNRASEETLKKYSKAVDLIRKRDYLNKKFNEIYLPVRSL
jgi:hypothetical protein